MSKIQQNKVNIVTIKLTKLSELEDALNPNNIEEGYTITEDVISDLFKKPTLDERFYLNNFSTSGVQEIIDDNTFKTYSSIYRWEEV